MSASPPDRSISAFLLDIEGTTTPISFVYDALFPYARARASQFIAARINDPDVRRDIVGLYEENARDLQRGLNPPLLRDNSGEPQIESISDYIGWLMDQDRKSTPLKSLQGRIWEEGYGSGELRSQVFADVFPALVRWREQGKGVSIYSSGSVLAQKLLFSHTEAGDLTGFINGYFDTTTGAKREARSYARIAAEIKRRPGEVVFISDVDAELDAAREAGLGTRLCVRPGNPRQANASAHQVIYTFDELAD
jgi:enolase-phosphatase E1